MLQGQGAGLKVAELILGGVELARIFIFESYSQLRNLESEEIHKYTRVFSSLGLCKRDRFIYKTALSLQMK